jgi:predicted RNase H-like nuclease
VHVIGIDWAATDEAKCGLALGHVHEGTVEILDVLTGRDATGKKSAPHVAEWLRQHPDVLVAVDAPLGWPSKLALAVAGHVAGEPLGKMVETSAFFSRETDRFVHRQFKKAPLEVGADRIARTAFSALCLLDDLREATGLPLKLAWAPNERGVIEVYPAATLKVIARRQRLAPYKKPDQVDARRSIGELLGHHLRWTASHAKRAMASDHVLDAVVCVVAGADFVSGAALAPPPELLEQALREGWIWVRSPPDSTA